MVAVNEVVLSGINGLKEVALNSGISAQRIAEEGAKAAKATEISSNVVRAFTDMALRASGGFKGIEATGTQQAVLTNLGQVSSGKILGA